MNRSKRANKKKKKKFRKKEKKKKVKTALTATLFQRRQSVINSKYFKGLSRHWPGLSPCLPPLRLNNNALTSQTNTVLIKRPHSASFISRNHRISKYRASGFLLLSSFVFSDNVNHTYSAPTTPLIAHKAITPRSGTPADYAVFNADAEKVKFGPIQCQSFDSQPFAFYNNASTHRHRYDEYFHFKPLFVFSRRRQRSELIADHSLSSFINVCGHKAVIHLNYLSKPKKKFACHALKDLEKFKKFNKYTKKGLDLEKAQNRKLSARHPYSMEAQMDKILKSDQLQTNRSELDFVDDADRDHFISRYDDFYKAANDGKNELICKWNSKNKTNEDAQQSKMKKKNQMTQQINVKNIPRTSTKIIKKEDSEHINLQSVTFSDSVCKQKQKNEFDDENYTVFGVDDAIKNEDFHNFDDDLVSTHDEIIEIEKNKNDGNESKNFKKRQRVRNEFENVTDIKIKNVNDDGVKAQNEKRKKYKNCRSLRLDLKRLNGSNLNENDEDLANLLCSSSLCGASVDRMNHEIIRILTELPIELNKQRLRNKYGRMWLAKLNDKKFMDETVKNVLKRKESTQQSQFESDIGNEPYSLIVNQGNKATNAVHEVAQFKMWVHGDEWSDFM